MRTRRWLLEIYEENVSNQRNFEKKKKNLAISRRN